MHDNDTDERLSQLTSASTFLITSGALSVLAYGLAWIFITRFLSPFGVTPDEIGISPTWILFRTPLLALPLIGFALALWAIFQARRILSPTMSRVFEILVDLLILGLILIVYFSPPFRPVHDLIIIITYSLFIGSLISVATWWLHRRGTAFIVSIGFILLFAISGVFWMWTGAAEGADSVAEGGSGSFTVLGQIPMLTTEPAVVLQLDSSGRMKHILPNCVTLLGSANGVTVVYDPQDEQPTVWRLPTDQVFLRRGCA